MACCLRTYHDHTISRWTVERHRDKMHLYMRETTKEIFTRFVAEKAVVVQLSFDSTPMRLSTTGLGNTKAVEVYVRHITARSADGEEMKYIPEVSVPANSSSAGVASTIKVEDLFIEEFTRRPGFRVLLINADAIPTNKAAVRMLVAELQVSPSLIVLPSICSSRTLSNATRWGLGDFPYGLYLRTAHGLDAVRCRDFHQHVDSMLRYKAPMMGDSLLQSETFMDYAGRVQDEYAPGIDCLIGDQPSERPADGRHAIRDMWTLFVKLVTGQRGPFARRGAREKSAELAARCAVLWPLGPPKHGELWYCTAGKTRDDYATALYDLFAYTVPVPVSSRWYDASLG